MTHSVIIGQQIYYFCGLSSNNSTNTGTTVFLNIWYVFFLLLQILLHLVDFTRFLEIVFCFFKDRAVWCPSFLPGLFNVMLRLLDEIEPLLLLAKDLDEDAEGSTHPALHLVRHCNSVLVLHLLRLAIDDFHCENVPICCTMCLRIRSHIVRDMPATMLAIVLDHLDRLVSSKDNVTCSTRFNLISTNRDVFISDSSSNWLLLGSGSGSGRCSHQLMGGDGNFHHL